MREQKHFILVLDPGGATLPLGKGKQVELQQISSIAGIKRAVAEVTASELAYVLKHHKSAKEISEDDYQKYVKKKQAAGITPQIHLLGSGLNQWPSLQIATSVGSVRVDYTSSNHTKHMVLPGDVAPISTQPVEQPELSSSPTIEEDLVKDKPELESLISDEDFDFADEGEITPPPVDEPSVKEKRSKSRRK